jgi:hypothetical protein
MPGMTEAILPIMGVTFAGVCLWLTVRVINRRERWAKWTLAATLFSVPALYVLSFGPVCWWLAKTVPEFPGGPLVGSNAAYAPRAYWPIGWTVDRYPSLRPFFAGYSRLFGKRSAVLLHDRWSGSTGTILWMRSREH